MPQQTNSEARFEHAREHLANERTFLAWIRTSLAVIGLGFVVVKFSLFVREMKIIVEKDEVRHTPAFSLPLGIVLIAVGAVITVISYFRYRRTQLRISNGGFVQSSTLIKLTAVLLVISCLLLILYLWLTT